MRTFETYEGILEVLAAQGSPSITEEVLTEHTTIVDDYRQGEETFPCLGLANGVLWFFDKTRRPLNQQGRPMKAKSEVERVPVGPALHGDEENRRRALFLFEGERDYLTALSIGVEGATLCGGVNNLSGVAIADIGARRTVYVAFDNDEEGVTAARHVAAQLKVDTNCSSVHVSVPPVGGTDFSDWVEAMPFESMEERKGEVIAHCRASHKINKGEARRILRDAGRPDAGALDEGRGGQGDQEQQADEFVAPNGDLVVLSCVLDRDEPWDASVKGTIKFLRYDRTTSRGTGVLTTEFLDSYDQAPMEEQEPGGDVGAGIYAPPLEDMQERPAVVQQMVFPIKQAPLEDRTIRLTSGAREYGTSEDLWQEVHDFISKYVVVSDSWYHISTGMVFLSWRYADANFKVLPYLRVYGRGGCGKSRFLSIMWELCNRALRVGGVRAANLYRTLQSLPASVTMVIEELNVRENTDGGKELVDMLNLGNQDDIVIARYNTSDSTTEFIKPFCPKIVSTDIDFDNEGLLRRAISEQMGLLPIPKEKRWAELPPEYYMDAAVLREKLTAWRFSKHGLPRYDDLIREFKDHVSDGVWQNWYPLLCMVPANFKDVIEGMIQYAVDQDDDLEFMHQQSPSAVVAAAAMRVQEGGRASLPSIITDLGTLDPRQGWTQREALNALRTLGLRPKRGSMGGLETNVHILNIDDAFHGALKRHELNMSVEDIIQNAPETDPTEAPI